MEIINTGIDDLFVIIPKIFEDNRGYFFESYNKTKFEKEGMIYNFIQDNQSMSKYGTIRGLHFQAKPFAQAKLVRVLSGNILDVAVDLRHEKSSFGKVFSVELNGENKKQLLIPEGFAHGFSVLSETAVVSYKINNIYKPDFEQAIKFDDKILDIDWKVENEKIIVSEKDRRNDNFDISKIYF
ncbi:MAG: dTDP-4-dehydrorhamnose 3,5-epimerase [Bacteroidales bacterium]|nr:dTDP-4-dehydrorhamnose 3,5-epimerase [Bacteroidales bacterium]